MDARDRRLKKEAIVQAEAYLNRKRGYVTPQEKKAFRIAEKLRHGYWLESLSGLNADERRAQLCGYRIFRTRVFFGGIFRPKRTERRTEQSEPIGGHLLK